VAAAVEVDRVAADRAAAIMAAPEAQARAAAVDAAGRRARSLSSATKNFSKARKEISVLRARPVLGCQARVEPTREAAQAHRAIRDRQARRDPRAALAREDRAGQAAQVGQADRAAIADSSHKKRRTFPGAPFFISQLNRSHHGKNSIRLSGSQAPADSARQGCP
jgi:hypothetical protein